MNALWENKQAYLDFLDQWKGAIFVFMLAIVAIIPLVYVVYLVKLRLLSSYKEKYDFVSKYEIRMWKVVNVLMGVVIASLVNLWAQSAVGKAELWFFVRMGMSIPVGGVHVYIAFMFLSVYYPKVLNKKLNRLRYAPRINPNTGNRMKLLSEEEEDVYLDEGMQAEEGVFSVDYDVWIDEETEDVVIEKYQGNLVAEECENCGFQTLRLAEENMVEDAENPDNSSLEQLYVCGYCKRQVERVVKVRKSVDEVKANVLSERLPKQIASLRIEVMRKSGELESYDFQNARQAREFLSQLGGTSSAAEGAKASTGNTSS